ncbi:iron complex outermembrane recepter protein [Nitrosomonas halophila]|uniref:Iron complex outermembrane recepter protein n=1 Tax=Nitrosomonas halophila TaxID=44576 RepID=A0A1H3GK38_9PROT|nr:iron complex outermembrane recepter protein [Nitrosomonas halophila]
MSRIRANLAPLPAWMLLAFLTIPVVQAESVLQPVPEEIEEARSQTVQKENIQLLDTMVIKTTAQSAEAVSKMSDRELRLRAADTLGKTLEREPGVHNLSYGPGVGQVVIRGMGGPRVRVMQNGIGTHDASGMSQDYAIAAETMLADRITVYRGPAALRFGGNAVGGMVDIKHQRIPDKIPKNGFAGRTEFRFDHNPGEKAGMIGLDMGKNRVALHLDYFHRAGGNTHIPGYALDEKAIVEQFQVQPTGNSKGVIQNSRTQSQGGSAGISVVGDAGYVGGSYHELTKNYGVPPAIPGRGDEDLYGPEAVRIDMRQRRFDLEGLWATPWEFLPSIEAKLGYIDYAHDEKDRGSPLMRLQNKVWESRLEFNHQHDGWLDGIAGFQWQDRQFSQYGFQTFTPASDISTLGLFLTETLMLADRVSLEFGARYDHQTTTPKDDAVRIPGVVAPLPLPGQLRFNTYSLAASLNYEAFAGGIIHLNWQRAQRAPDIQELLTSGPHFATRSFELGRMDLKREQADHFELGLNLAHNGFSLLANGYYKRIDNFIYLQNQGLFFNFSPEPPRFQLACANLQNCLPVFGYQGDDADFWGYETELHIPLPFSAYSPHLKLFSDYVRGWFRDGALGDVPRLPPLRAGFELTASHGPWQAGLRYTRALAQNRPGLKETSTDGYDRLDLDMSYDWKATNRIKLLLFSKVSNMTQSVIRNSTSFLRNFAPEPGFSFEAGLRATF